MTDDARVDRRTVLKATGAAVATGVGAAATAGDAGTHIPSPGCVETTREAEAYDSCAAATVVERIPEGTDGFVTDKCYGDAGNWIYELQVACQRTAHVDSDAATGIAGCC